MNALKWILGVLAIAALVGCGGGGTTVPGQVAGAIVDLDGNPVRDAVVTITDDNQSTLSNSAGAYLFADVREGVWQVKAQVSVNGVVYSGQTAAAVFSGERSKSNNVALVRLADQATVFGVVRDRFGNVLQGAHVFAYLVNSSGFTLSSVMDITNGEGEYELKSLAGGYEYIINGSARGYSNDRDSVVLTPGESRRFDITLGDASDPLFPAPTSLSAVAWTSPAIAGRGGQNPGNALKDLIAQRLGDARRGKVQPTRTAGRSANGNHIEVDLYWDYPVSNMQYILGYGVYRATTQGGLSSAIDFLRDPETVFFQDLDDNLLENRNYYYEITALNVRYPDTSNSESDFSNRYGVQTLGDMVVNSPTFSPLTFHWQSATAATGYYVYVFEDYPDFGVSEIWSTPSPVAGNSVNYGGPSLISGRRYYYVVLGVANGNDSRTMSPVESFIAN